mgnify:CR=1 FL=1
MPVVSLHDNLPAAAAVVGYDEIGTRKAIAQFSVQLLTKRHGEPNGEVTLLQGVLGLDANIFGTEGFVNEMKKYPNIGIIAMTSTDWDPKKALNTSEIYLVTYRGLDVICGVSDVRTVPTDNVVKRAGKTDQVTLVSVDGSDFAFQAVQDG